MTLFFFFFSSRRRHTRYWRDWSSDVCSSDLPPDPARARRAVPDRRDPRGPRMATGGRGGWRAGGGGTISGHGQIGRTAGGGRGEILGGAVLLKKKKITSKYSIY